MVLPSGGRVKMVQIGTSNLYESQDSTYTHLTDNGTSGALVRTTDGTQFVFTPVSVNNEYRCTQIKDRNGNYISATYNTTTGHLLTITDTLDRDVNFIYDANNKLQYVRQTWAGGAHDWATFTYDQVFVSPAFGGGLAVNGPNGSNVTVLTKVALADGSYFVYKHVYGVAGAVLIGNRLAAGGLAITPQPGAQPATTGWGLVYSQWNIDKAQMSDPTHHNEAVAEVADDYAGIDIGKWMGQAIDGTLSQDELRNNIFNRLCDH